MVGCYLVRHAGRLLGVEKGVAPGDLALERITALRALQGVPLPEASPEMDAQRCFVLDWGRGS